MDAVGIVLAGGEGVRMSGETLPKQFLDLGGVPVIVRTLEAFEKTGAVGGVVVVMNPNWLDHGREVLWQRNLSKLLAVIPGGATRQDSSYNGLLYLNEAGRRPRLVAIHDAVRPFVTPEIISASLEAASLHGASDVVVKTSDTIVQGKDGLITGMLDRSSLYNGQTPQSFRFELILEAHERAREEGLAGTTDDVRLVHRLKEPVALVEGSPLNMKITTPEDLVLAEMLAKRLFRD